MKDGHYWVKFYPMGEAWYMFSVRDGVLYHLTTTGTFDFGTVAEFQSRYPEAIVEVVDQP